MLHEPEHMLWTKVLALAVQDAKRGGPEARAWFHSPDARRVASLAGLDPDSFSRIVKELDWEVVAKLPRKRRRRRSVA